MNTPKVAIFIPARLASQRLPNKPLALIGNKPMIIHVMEQAKKTNLGPVYVAAAEEAIAEKVRKWGGEAILTDPNHPSGTDRIYEAYKKLDSKHEFDYIVNLQGDLPNIAPQLIKTAVEVMHAGVDIGTLISVIKNEEEITNPNSVKVVLAKEENKESGRALYFSRAAIPHNSKIYYHHIGIYVYTRKSFEKFISLPESQLEKTEKLEQLRALENGMIINAAIVDSVPISVDTPEDLEKIRSLLVN